MEKKKIVELANKYDVYIVEDDLGAYYLNKKYNDILKFIEKTFTPYITEVKENIGKYHAKELLQEYTQGLTTYMLIYQLEKSQLMVHLIHRK